MSQNNTENIMMRIMIKLICIGAVVATASLPNWHTGAENNIRASSAELLNYAVDRGVLRNPWLIKAASDWPNLTPAEMSERSITPPANEAKHFQRWVNGTLAEAWRPASFQKLPYFAGTGFVHVKVHGGYRLRLREARKPASPKDPRIITRALVMAVEPAGAAFPKFKTPNDLLAFIAQFLRPELVVDPETVDFIAPKTTLYFKSYEKLPAAYTACAGGMLISMWPTKSGAAFPVWPDAWTDGKVLLIGLYENVHYRAGPIPLTNVKPTPPPAIGEE